MSTEERLAALEAKMQDINDRQEILACIVRNARGCDRHHSQMLSSSYHADGIDEHGLANIIAGPEYCEWANEVHTKGSLQNMHHITTHSCEIDGDVAHADSYVIGLFLNPDGEAARLLAGRYLDRLERRNGEWKIALRRCTVEVIMKADASIIKSDYVLDMGFLKGLRDKQDISYQRPMSLDETPPGHRWEGTGKTKS